MKSPIFRVLCSMLGIALALSLDPEASSQITTPPTNVGSAPTADCSGSNALAPSCTGAGGGSMGTATTPFPVVQAAPPAPQPSVYLDDAGIPRTAAVTPADPAAGYMSDLQQSVLLLTGKHVEPIGAAFFRENPTTFAPATDAPVDPTYVLGTGDEVVLRMWGHDSFNGRLTVDRLGNIYVPHVGSIRVAGETFDEARRQIETELRRVYSHFEDSVNLGSLRSVQVFVLGQARHPGSYTVGGLSTVLNALLVSGGPDRNGSVRSIELKRDNRVVATIDLYDILLRGNKQSDVRLQAGDVLFIPFAGTQVAAVGAVRNEAIYELRKGENLDDLLALAGGMTASADRSQITISRTDGAKGIETLSVRGDSPSLVLINQDIVLVGNGLTALAGTVTLRGNLASPGRFQWFPGMKLSDILPDRQALLTQDYWRIRALQGRVTPTFLPLRDDAAGRSADPFKTLPATGSHSVGDTDTTTQTPLSNAPSTIAEQQQRASDLVSAHANQHVEIAIPVAEIDWSYAVIERMNPETLRDELIPFNLGKLVINHDPSQDLPLMKGDTVTILSQADIHVATDQQTKYVRIEGEVSNAGVYSVAPDETLADVVRRAGGTTKKAYLFGSSFSRESSRTEQQQRLDEYVSDLTLEFSRASARRLSTSASSAASQTAAAAADQVTLRHLQSLRATGRIVLQFTPRSSGDGAIPALPLENGDVFRIPSEMLTVGVVGAVNGPNTFVYDYKMRVRDYLKLAGMYTQYADPKRAFLIRANGSVVSARSVGTGLFDDRFGSLQVFPGDTIIVPEKPAKGSYLSTLVDYSQIVSQFALGAVAIHSF